MTSPVVPADCAQCLGGALRLAVSQPTRTATASRSALHVVERVSNDIDHTASGLSVARSFLETGNEAGCIRGAILRSKKPRIRDEELRGGMQGRHCRGLWPALASGKQPIL